MGINDIVRSMFDGYKEARDSNTDRRFDQLNKPNAWIKDSYMPLLEVDDLDELLKEAKTKEQYNAILDHMYRHDATRVKPYKQIENKIIKHFWEDDDE